MFCVECGEEGPVYDNLCADCFLKKNQFTKVPDKVDLFRCSHCREFSLDREWVSADIEEAVSRAAVNSVKVHKGAEVGEVEVALTMEDKNSYLVHLTLEIDIEGLRKWEDQETLVRVKGTSCPKCSKIKGSYFESILQIRSRDRSMPLEEMREVLQKIQERVDKVARNNREVFISKVEEMHSGFDVYLSTTAIGKAISKELAEEYGAERKESSSLVGRREGKDVYRITYLIRLPAYKVHDIVEYGEKLYLVVGMSPKMASIMELRTHEFTAASHQELQSAEVVGNMKDGSEAVVVSESDEELQMMHPVSYETIEIQKPEGMEIGDSMPVFTHKGTVYLLPTWE